MPSTQVVSKELTKGLQNVYIIQVSLTTEYN